MMDGIYNKKTLIIDKNCVFKSKIENREDFDKSFFKEAYDKAESCLSDIVNFEYDKDYKSNDFNNIIAFVGDRGSGKTSTMKSFRNSLTSKNKDSKFLLLDIIDPMLFSNKDSIIEIVVAQMFKEFSNKKSNDNLMKKKELARRFEKVYEDIKMIHTSKGNILEQSYDNLEALIDLTSAISLKDDLNELITNYLKYKSEDDKVSETFIVISIDDLDMNLTVGEKMLEDIRKYLVLPNVVILMAVKIEQLEEVVAQKFTNDLKGNLELAKCIEKQREFKTGIDDKTEKYLEKLIPFSRRVYMPNLSVNDFNVKINDFDNIFTKDKNDKDLNSKDSIINHNLNKKIGYSIITREQYKAIIPQNLRLFIDFIVMLNSMKFGDKSINYREENIVIFKTYIRDVLISNIKDIEKRRELTNILECRFEKLNGAALFYLNRCIEKDKKEDNELIDVIEERVSWLKKNKLKINENRIEYGDIITWVKMLQLNEANVTSDNSVEIFKCIYSMRLLEKFYTDSVTLFEETGFNFVGDYFQLTSNKRISCILREVELKNSNIFKGHDNEYEFRFAIFNILFNKDEKFYRYNRLLRREKKEYLIDEEYNNFNNVELGSLNMVSYCMYKELLRRYTNRYKEELDEDLSGQIKYLKNELDDRNKLSKEESLECQYSLIINIDFWMKILNVLDSIVQLTNGQNPLSVMVKNLTNINDAFKKLCDEYNLEFIDKYNNTNVEGESNDKMVYDYMIVDSEEIDKFNNFLNKNRIYFEVNFENFNKAKKGIEVIKNYIQLKESAESMRNFKGEAKKKLYLLDIKNLKKDERYLEYFNKIEKKIDEVNPQLKNGSQENIDIVKSIFKLVKNFEEYIDGWRRKNSYQNNGEDSTNIDTTNKSETIDNLSEQQS